MRQVFTWFRTLNQIMVPIGSTICYYVKLFMSKMTYSEVLEFLFNQLQNLKGKF